MKKRYLSQQAIVFAIFVVILVGFSLFLPGFLNWPNVLTLLQNVAILGILGLGMAIVVIGRSIDISMVAALAVPPGLVMQMVQNGHPVWVSVAAALGLALLFGLVNGWLIAYAEVPSLYTTLACGVFLAGLGQTFFFQLDVVQWPSELDLFAWLGRGSVFEIPTPVIMFGGVALCTAFFLRFTGMGAYVYAMGDNPTGARRPASRCGP